MRDSFIRELFQCALTDSNIHLITGDLGFGVLTKFANELPQQYTNAGVAEQNMTGLAAGMAMNGFKVFTYSIGNFSTLRCLEQIRNDICYHDLDVTVVSVGGGFSYGALGFSHHATEDLTILRSIPGMSVYSPGCVWEAAEITKALLKKPGPKYLRLDKSGTKSTQLPGEHFEFEKIRTLGKTGPADVAIIASGGILEEALQAAELLDQKSLSCKVLGVHCLKPIIRDDLYKQLKDTTAIFTLEENVVEGGLGSLIAEEILELGFRPKYFKRMGIRVQSSIVGDQNFLRSYHGLTGHQIAGEVQKLVGVGEAHVQSIVSPILEASV